MRKRMYNAHVPQILVQRVSWLQKRSACSSTSLSLLDRLFFAREDESCDLTLLGGRQIVPVTLESDIGAGHYEIDIFLASSASPWIK